MSVAVRRESDDEHLQPRFELPIPPGLIQARTEELAVDKAIETLSLVQHAAANGVLPSP